MDQSILNNVKKVLGLAEDYTAFDVDVILHINATFGVLHQLGVGPVEGFEIEDSGPLWDDIGLPLDQKNMVKSYMYLKVKYLFDPPTTSFLLDAMKQQIDEFETRLHYAREDLMPVPTPTVSAEEVVYVPLPTYIEGGY